MASNGFAPRLSNDTERQSTNCPSVTSKGRDVPKRKGLQEMRDAAVLGSLNGQYDLGQRCFDPTCNTLFTICASCDRGQRYCSDACRQRMRRQQLRASGRRYQASAAGRQNHSGTLPIT
jgi:hypothetical protein